MSGERAPWLPGYRVKIVDGNCLEASEPRIHELRQATARALPGKSVVVYEPAPGLGTEVFPCEEGHAQERSLFGSVLKTVNSNALWIADRNFCPRAFLTETARRGGFFVIREHRGLPCAMVSPMRSCGRTSTGHVAQQRGCVVDEHGHQHVFRRLRIIVNQTPRDGDTALYILTNLPGRVSAKRVTQLYQNRWKVDISQL